VTLLTAYARKFEKSVRTSGSSFERLQTKTLQVNVGKLCNQACYHCHVDAGPTKKKENMNEQTAIRVLALMRRSPSVETIDLTGGAPELNPNFRMSMAVKR